MEETWKLTAEKEGEFVNFLQKKTFGSYLKMFSPNQPTSKSSIVSSHVTSVDTRR